MAEGPDAPTHLTSAAQGDFANRSCSCTNVSSAPAKFFWHVALKSEHWQGFSLCHAFGSRWFELLHVFGSEVADLSDVVRCQCTGPPDGQAMGVSQEFLALLRLNGVPVSPAEGMPSAPRTVPDQVRPWQPLCIGTPILIRLAVPDPVDRRT